MTKTMKLPKPPWDKMKISRSTYFRRERRKREDARDALQTVMGLPDTNNHPSKVGRMAMILDDEPVLNDYQRGQRDALIDEFMREVTHYGGQRHVWHLSDNQITVIYEALRKAGYGNGRDDHREDAAVLRG